MELNEKLEPTNTLSKVIMLLIISNCIILTYKYEFTQEAIKIYIILTLYSKIISVESHADVLANGESRVAKTPSLRGLAKVSARRT